MIALISLILLWVFRSAAATLAGLGTIGVAVLWTFGLMGWLGWERNNFTQVLAPLLLVMGVCDGVHLLSRYVAQPPSVPRLEALLAACDELSGPLDDGPHDGGRLRRAHGQPVGEPPRFGALALFGVMISMFLTFTLLPIIVSYIPRNILRNTVAHARWDDALEGLASWSQRHRAVPLGVTLMLSLAAFAGLRSLKLEASFEDLYGRDSQVVRWAHAVAETLRPPDSLEIGLEPPGSLKETPQAFAVTAQLQSALESISGLGRAHSIIDPMQRLNTMLHHDELRFVEGEAGVNGWLH
jgi:predicted RND superfamily exporter protein